jgi:hypothetical protein
MMENRNGILLGINQGMDFEHHQGMDFEHLAPRKTAAARPGILKNKSPLVKGFLLSG